ncbi:MAG: 16S rRNA (cytidine(1402)-2'-O)-methyltransferase [Shimia sp.]
MNWQQVELPPGLHLVATPIGNARDVTLRALDVLASADMLAAEDTRTLRRLMDLHAVPLRGRRIVAYHDHNGDRARPGLLAAMGEGRSVAYASEAGTPLLADPGFDLVREARAQGTMVTSAPGPSALVTAASLSGLPTDRLYFGGFLPTTRAARRSALADLRELRATLIFYEAPSRVNQTLRDVCETLGERDIRIVREATKRFEEVIEGRAGSLDAEGLRGECVILVDRAASAEGTDAEVVAALTEALRTMRVKDAATAVAGATGRPKRDVYQMALTLGGGERGGKT